MENSFENMIEKEIANYQKEAYGRRECAPRCHAYLGAWGAIVFDVGGFNSLLNDIIYLNHSSKSRYRSLTREILRHINLSISDRYRVIHKKF